MAKDFAATDETQTAGLALPGPAVAWLAAGAAAAIFASGGRWDVAAAAWLMPVFLLRFTRVSTLTIAAMGVLGAMLVQNFTYMWLTAAPLNPMTIVLGLLVSAAYALPLILDRALAGRLSGWGQLLVLPLGMVAAEFAIGATLPLGTSLGMRAITQGENLALLQIISITGPYAIAFLIGMTATVATKILEAPSRASLLRHGLPLAAGLFLVVAFGQARLTFSAPSAGTPMVKIAAITPDLEARLATNSVLTGASLPASEADRARAGSDEMRAAYARIAADLLADTSRAARAGAKIVVWSETAAPTTEADKPALLTRVSEVAQAEGIYIVAAIGVPFERNETFLFGPDSQQLWHYRKNHPVPGMEPVAPFRNAVPVVATPYGRLASVICFDGDFPALARVEADIMITPSWDWPEVAYAHSMRMVRLRAIENGYSLLRPVFNGVTGAFDQRGRTLAMQETMSEGAHMLVLDMPMRKVATIYGLVGDAFAWGCIAGLGVLLVLSGRRRRQS